MRIVRTVAVACLLGAGLISTAPAHASLPMKFWIEYAGNGTVAFACHNIGANAGTGGVNTANWTSVSCTFNGFRSASVESSGWHATSAGLADAALGSTVEVCISAASVWGFPNMYEIRYDNCVNVTVAPAGTLYL